MESGYAPAEQQSVPDVPNEDSTTPALSESQEETTAPSGVNTSQQKTSPSPADEGLNSNECTDEGCTYTTDCLSEFPLTVSDPCHSQQTLGGQQDESEQTAKLERVITEENLSSPAAAEQEDAQPNQHAEPLDVCVSQEV